MLFIFIKQIYTLTNYFLVKNAVSLYFSKLFYMMLFSLSVFGCQNQNTMDVTQPENHHDKSNISIPNTEVSSKAYTPVSYKPVPCKTSSTLLIKDKTKIRAMLFKAEKINNKMSEEAINTYVNNFIKNKASLPCKPIVKQPSNLTSSEK